MTADLLIRRVHVATMADDAGYGELQHAAVAVMDGRIAWVGEERAAPHDLKACEEYDGGGAWLLPALIDCHTHLVWAGNRAAEFEARLQGQSYGEIARAGGGILATVRATRDATKSELLRLTLARADALIAEGATTIEIKSGYGLDVETELSCLRVAKQIARNRPVRVAPTYLGAHAVPPEFEGRPDDYIRFLCDTALPAVRALGGVTAVDAFCETIAFTPDQCRRYFERAKALGFQLKLHADQLSDSGGAALIAELGGLSADHLEYTSEASVRAMADAATVAVLLPGAFYTLRETQKPPIDLLRQHRVAIALATDCNPGTSSCTSLTMILNMGCVLFGLTPSEALAGVTRHAAKALGLQAEIGRIAVGLRADLALFAVDHPRDLCAFIGRSPIVRRWFGGA